MDQHDRPDPPEPARQSRLRKDRQRGAETRHREDEVHGREVEVELGLDEDVEERDQLARAERGQEARQQEPEEEAAVQDDQPEPAAALWSLTVGSRPIAGQQVDRPECDDAQDRHASQQDLVRRGGET